MALHQCLFPVTQGQGTCQRLARSAVKPEIRDRNIHLKATTDRNNPDPPQARRAQGMCGPVRDKPCEWKSHMAPCVRGGETLPIGFPRSQQIRRPQMQIIDLAISDHHRLNPCPAGRINRCPGTRKVKCALHKTAIVFQTHRAAHPKRASSRHNLVPECARRQAPHYPVRYQRPTPSSGGQKPIQRQIIDDFSRIHYAGTPPIAQTGSSLPDTNHKHQSCGRSSRPLAARLNASRPHPLCLPRRLDLFLAVPTLARS